MAKRLLLPATNPSIEVEHQQKMAQRLELNFSSLLLVINCMEEERNQFPVTREMMEESYKEMLKFCRQMLKH